MKILYSLNNLNITIIFNNHLFKEKLTIEVSTLGDSFRRSELLINPV